MNDLVVSMIRVDGSDPSIALPNYETVGAAAMDLRANLKPDLREQGTSISAGARALIPSGLAIALPVGYEAQIRPRSGLALKHGVTVLNSPGTIDSDYRGEIGIILINHGTDAFHIHHGDRIAQMLFTPVTRATLSLSETLDITARGAGGFGSTGQV